MLELMGENGSDSEESNFSNADADPDYIPQEPINDGSDEEAMITTLEVKRGLDASDNPSTSNETQQGNENNHSLNISEQQSGKENSNGSPSAPPSSSYQSDQANDQENSRKLTRKRKRDPSQWKRNVAKIKRQAGENYTSTRTGKSVPGRVIKDLKDCNKCKFKCCEKNLCRREIKFAQNVLVSRRREQSSLLQ
ncbi:hypothetical protein RRG08_027984 [Elysia crispata]|uniref:Uncharacterized protein n=1 Tax=Elysia crispata TaxID=231223 RepID=A0AAE1BBE5_9GAST|nr:hypothetical protein RRG08_027984 [Elysia crispata]